MNEKCSVWLAEKWREFSVQFKIYYRGDTFNYNFHIISIELRDIKIDIYGMAPLQGLEWQLWLGQRQKALPFSLVFQRMKNEK